MSKWRLAESLKQLRVQLNAEFPNRDKKSDGSVGDLKHQARKSDHNPNSAGVVTAIDITHDPKALDCNRLADVLFESKDPRIKYLIWNRKITTPDKKSWKKYTGANAHAHHLHVSVSSDFKLYDSKKDWDLDGLTDDVAKVSAANLVPVENRTSQAAGSSSGESERVGLTGKTQAETTEMANQASSPETTETTTVEKTDSMTTQITSAKNEQDVNQPAQVPEPAPQGVAAKLKAGIGTLFGSAILYTAAEKFGAMSFSTQAIILFAVVAVIALIGFMFWAWLDAWKSAKKTEITALANTDKNRRDIEWVKNE